MTRDLCDDPLTLREAREKYFVANAFGLDGGYSLDWVDVKVTADWVTLTGEVKHQSDSDAAFAAVSRLAGVGGITNEIKVITAGLGG